MKKIFFLFILSTSAFAQINFSTFPKIGFEGFYLQRTLGGTH
jgi:hypothetical protein